MYNEKSYADVAQLVEQLIRNQQVAGPSPAISSINKYSVVCKRLHYIFIVTINENNNLVAT